MDLCCWWWDPDFVGLQTGPRAALSVTDHTFISSAGEQLAIPHYLGSKQLKQNFNFCNTKWRRKSQISFKLHSEAVCCKACKRDEWHEWRTDPELLQQHTAHPCPSAASPAIVTPPSDTAIGLAAGAPLANTTGKSWGTEGGKQMHGKATSTKHRTVRAKV